MKKILTGTQTRTYDIPALERAMKDDKAAYFKGRSVVFNSWSGNLGGFKEIIYSGAADGALMDRAIAVFNHNENLLLATVKAGTLRASVNDLGIDVEIDEADTAISRDCSVWVSRGEIDSMSFKFLIDANDDLATEWKYNNEEGIYEHHIRKIAEILDFSLVTRAAYEATTASLSRGIDIEAVKERFTPEKNENQAVLSRQFAIDRARFRTRNVPKF
jgi:hypothetical protein